MNRARQRLVACGMIAAVSLAGCTSAGSGAAGSSTASARTPAAPSSRSSDPSTAPAAPSTAPSSRASGPAHSAATSSSPSGRSHPPVIVLDPGHSPSIHAIDPRTKIDASDYANEPEMRDVYAVALIVRTTLERAGYRVVMTKKSVDARVSLAQRAHIANRVHASLAISIHDQAGANGGIGFTSGNNIVYYQSVGTYRTNTDGKKIYFTNHHLARISQRYGQVFQHQRSKVEDEPITLQGDVGYDLGSRGLAPGNIWIVQLLSKVPWIYNESGGNSAGRIGLDGHDKRVYARGLVAGVERCVPPPR